jgi:hypothetical protein
MENNLYASIVECNLLFEQGHISRREQTLREKFAYDEQTGTKVKKAPLDSDGTQFSEDVAMQKEFHFVISVTGAERQMLDGMLGKQTHIMYTISFLRVDSGEYSTTHKRFSEIYDIYTELQKDKALANETDLVFPNRTEIFALNQRNDPNSKFVRQRKVDVQKFLRQMFTKNLQLFKNEKAIEFFELKESFKQLDQASFVSHCSTKVPHTYDLAI